jgi:hypothetical protein
VGDYGGESVAHDAEERGDPPAVCTENSDSDVVVMQSAEKSM